MRNSAQEGWLNPLKSSIVNSSACIGLADVVDSLMAVKTLVYDRQVVSLADLERAIARNFEGDGALLAMIRTRVPLFGSGSAEAVAMANRVTRRVVEVFARLPHYRGGRYTAGFWSMSNHVAFGTLSGALPNGKLRGKPFTPGLTPEAHASTSILDNLRDVAQLEPHSLRNNIAFNVKVVPRADEPRAQAVGTMAAYTKTYAQLGGMQAQFNVVNSANKQTSQMKFSAPNGDHRNRGKNNLPSILVKRSAVSKEGLKP